MLDKAEAGTDLGRHRSRPLAALSPPFSAVTMPLPPSGVSGNADRFQPYWHRAFRKPTRQNSPVV